MTLELDCCYNISLMFHTCMAWNHHIILPMRLWESLEEILSIPTMVSMTRCPKQLIKRLWRLPNSPCVTWPTCKSLLSHLNWLMMNFVEDCTTYWGAIGIAHTTPIVLGIPPLTNDWFDVMGLSIVPTTNLQEDRDPWGFPRANFNQI